MVAKYILALVYLSTTAPSKIRYFNYLKRITSVFMVTIITSEVAVINHFSQGETNYEYNNKLKQEDLGTNPFASIFKG